MKRKWEARRKSVAMSMKHIPDSWIDVSDKPELSDEQLRRTSRWSAWHRLAKHLIAFRLSPRLFGCVATDGDETREATPDVDPRVVRQIAVARGVVATGSFMLVKI